MVDTPIPNKCQYWIEDEPVQCANWDESSQTCVFEPSSADDAASHAPYCNGIGTATSCNKYDGTGTKARCVLPDPSRQVGNRQTGEKWSRDEIDGYNNGNCDGKGTDTSCNGYSPYHMSFSKLMPTWDEGIDEEGLTTFSGFEYRLPFNYEVYNKRAQLSRCYWWEAETGDFTIDDGTGKINPPEFKCTNPDEITDQFNELKWDSNLGMTRASCNGCKPECPRYTSSVCWKYCIDEKTRQGDKVLAEQILELRYYIRKDGWTTSEYEESFEDPYIFAGTKLWRYSIEQSGRNYLIDANRTYISDFKVFTVNYERSFLTAGTPNNTYKQDYPTKVRELKDITLAPIIINEFDEDEEGNNIFEVSKLLHKDILIVGDVFYYGSKAYAINLSDPELGFLPRELIYFNSMAEIEARYIEAKDTDGYNRFYADLECKLENLMRYWPNKIIESEISGNNSFYINVETFFGGNDIVVFDKGSGVWEYDKVSVKKILCNGIIGQTSFFVDNSGTTVDYLPSYEFSFAGFANRTGEITFSFFPFISSYGGAEVDYVYNDGIRERLDANKSLPAAFSTYEVCYKLFKVKVLDELELDQNSFRIFGNAGWILVTIPDENKLSNVIKPWEINNDYIVLTVIDSLDVSHDIEMEIVDREENIDKLEVNQIVIKPKDINQFRQPCSAVLTIGIIYNYEKHSFNETPTEEEEDYEEIREGCIGEDDVIDYRDTLTIEYQHGQYKLTRFGTEALVIVAVFKGITGRPKGQTKTKMITWVRQPYCRDVEINYSWYAEYQKCILLPEKECYGTPGVKCDIELKRISMTPPCGDHDLSIISGKGPMWYPYGECDSSARWNITGVLTEWDIGIMDCFWEDVEPPHGYWDMRMLGPDNKEGHTCDTHAQLWACTCDWSFCNYEKQSSNIFSGIGMYRGGLEGEVLFRCIRNNGSSPKFGNVFRDFLRTFRSIDNVDYYYFSGKYFLRNRKWMPMPEFYTASDVTAGTSEYPFLLYSSDDYDNYYADSGSFVHPMGLMLANSQIEGVDINETIHPSNLRYRFEDVFRTHFTVAAVYYPYPKNPYFRSVGGVPVPVMSWYTYKDYPGIGGGLDKSIQWAWQEIWKDLERATPIISDFTCDAVSTTICCSQGTIGECEISLPYYSNDEENCVEVYGKHCFLEIEHSDYKYDVSLAEHRLVCDEGDHVVTLTPPDFTINEKGDMNEFFTLQLDNGPERLFDINGDWDPYNQHEYHNLYTVCTNTPWSDSVTLFATGYDNVSETEAENDSRMILTYDGVGEESKEYYQRGLDIALLTNKFDYISTKTELMQPENYDIKFNSAPDLVGEEIVVGDWYSFPYCFNVTYNCSIHNDVEIEFGIKRKKSDNIGAITKVECKFTFGARQSEEKEPVGGLWFGELYHVPAMEIYVDSEALYMCDEMYLADKNEEMDSKYCMYDLGLDINDIFNARKIESNKRENGQNTDINLKIKFRIAPTESEKEEISGLNRYYIFADNMVKLECVYIYHTNFVEAKENIKTWERKYHVSYGEHGDFPPHGYDSTGSLLYPSLTDASTVYQYDSIGGVAGMPNSSGALKTMNKCRGRIMDRCRIDKEPLSGNDLYEWEAEQKEIHDDVVDSGDISFQMTAVCPPGLKEYLIKAGVVFQPWSCAFVNTAVMKLSAVMPRQPFSAEGHYFDWDFSRLKRQICGRLFARFWADTFEYVYRKAATGERMWDSMDAIVAYLYGAGAYLVNPLNFLANEMSISDRLSENIKALTVQQVLFESQQCQLPPASPIL